MINNIKAASINDWLMEDIEDVLPKNILIYDNID
jgi:hypothetical protein